MWPQAYFDRVAVCWPQRCAQGRGALCNHCAKHMNTVLRRSVELFLGCQDRNLRAEVHADLQGVLS